MVPTKDAIKKRVNLGTYYCELCSNEIKNILHVVCLLKRLGLVQILFYQWISLMLVLFGTEYVLYYMLAIV